MGSKNDLTRKDFLTLTFTMIGSAAVAARCSDNNNAADGGAAGRGGTTGSGGTSHATGQGGAGGTGGGAGGAGTTGNGGTTGAGGGGGTTAAACSDPLPESQSASDHMHTVTIHPSVLSSTAAQTFDTSVAASHMHAVTLEPVDLVRLKGGGTVMVTSTVSVGHSHVFTISCQ